MKSWIDYMMNEEGKTVLDREGGLISFIIKDGECFVTDFYVEEDHRGTDVALKLARDAEAYAKDFYCDRMTCNVFINESNRAMFGHKIRIFSEFGFMPTAANNNVIVMMKGI